MDAGQCFRNLSSLSRKTKVAYSTIRRIMKKEAEPNIVSVLAIVGAIMTIEERVAFLRTYHILLLESSSAKHTTTKVKDHRPECREILSEYLRREPHNKIFNMAATKAGISYVEQVRRLAEIWELTHSMRWLKTTYLSKVK